MALIFTGPVTGTSWIVIWPLLTTTGMLTSLAVFGAAFPRISKLEYTVFPFTTMLNVRWPLWVR